MKTDEERKVTELSHQITALYRELKAHTATPRGAEISDIPKATLYQIISLVARLRSLGWQASFHDFHDLVHIFPLNHVEVYRFNVGKSGGKWKPHAIMLTSIPATSFLANSISKLEWHRGTGDFDQGDEAAIQLLTQLKGAIQ